MAGDDLVERISTAEAARYLGTSRRHVENLIRKGVLEAWDVRSPGATRARWAVKKAAVEGMAGVGHEWRSETKERKRRVVRAMLDRARELGMGNVELAEYLGVSSSTVEAWARGRPPALRHEEAIRILNAELAKEKKTRDRISARVFAGLEAPPPDPEQATKPATPPIAERKTKRGEALLLVRAQRKLDRKRALLGHAPTPWSKERIDYEELAEAEEKAERRRMFAFGLAIGVVVGALTVWLTGALSW